jgi:DNA polymerase
VGKTCILGLGYGTGAAKLRHTLKTQPPGADLTEERCKEIVDLYRATNDKIVELWSECEKILTPLSAWPVEKRAFYIDKHKVLSVYPEGVRLPNGLHIRYSGLTLDNYKWSYTSRKGPVSIWGGTIVENVVQALARIIVGEQMLKLRAKYRPVLTVHDAAVLVVPDDEVEEAVSFVTEVMSTPPDWAVGLPVACEAKYAYSYGEC